MAQLTTRDAINVGRSIVSGEMLRSVDEEMRILPGANHPLVDFFGYGPPVRGDVDYKHEWLRNHAMEPAFALLATVTAGTTTLTAGTHLSASDAALLQIGSVFHVLPQYGSGQTEELIRVTNISGTTITITRDEGNKNAGTGYAHAAGDRCHIVLPSYLDKDTLPASPYRRGEFVNNYFIQSMWAWSGTDYETLRKSYLDGNASEALAKAITEGRQLAMKQLNNQIIYGVKRQMTDTQPGNFSGLRDMITTNVITPADGVLTPGSFEDGVDAAAKYDESVSSWTMLCHPESVRIINGVLRAYFSGNDLPPEAKSAPLNQLRAIDTSLGKVELLPVRQQPRGELIALASKNDFKLYPGQVDGMGTGWVEFEMDARFHRARKRETGLSWIGTAKLMNEARSFKIVGWNPTISSYAGAW